MYIKFWFTRFIEWLRWLSRYGNAAQVKNWSIQCVLKYIPIQRFSVSKKSAELSFNQYFVCFLAFDFCRFYVVTPFFHPRHNGQWPTTSKDFYTRSYPLHYYLNSWERASISLFQCSVLNKGTTGTIFITSLVWRGRWLGTESGTPVLYH